MSSINCSHGMVLATAMAVSGTVILLALRLQKSLPDHFPNYNHQALRPCISSEGKEKKKKKRVKFAKDVVDPRGNGEEFRRQRIAGKFKVSGGSSDRGMPENRVALYNGILRDRVIQRLTYSY
ncbi:hypothetical protein M5689_011252 [Euphorbia peplus]|nr:hypothetical protein M5689_011252 [Euphorbia peplus]